MVFVTKIKRKVKVYEKSRKSTLLFYSLPIREYAFEDNESNYSIIDNFNTLKEYNQKNLFTLNHLINDDCKKRFEAGSKIVFSQNSEGWIGYGWVAKNGAFWIAEIDSLIDISDSKVNILFDFYTRDEYRGCGIYPKLIKKIASMECEKEYLIYCYDFNVSSKRGIEKAGAIKELELCHNSASKTMFWKNHGIKFLGSRLKLLGLLYRKDN